VGQLKVARVVLLVARVSVEPVAPGKNMYPWGVTKATVVVEDAAPRLRFHRW